MKYAERISDMINAFSPEPLKIEQMAEFYCNNTMEYRTSDKYSSPIEDIFDMCQETGKNNAFLLLGHRGCGKSTELNYLSGRLAAKGYQVRTVVSSMDLDLLNIKYSDLFILMGEALLKMAEELECALDNALLKDIRNFWSDGTEIRIIQEEEASALETGISARTPGLLGNIFSVFADIKADLKFNEAVREEYRMKISNRSSEWIGMLGRVSEEIAVQTGGCRPVIIFEDLDKLNPEDAWQVFYNYAPMLSGMPFHVIYTFPIGLSYDARFSVMESYFTVRTLPMIKIETIENEPYQEGINIIRNIIEKRASLDLFDANALEMLIQYTGGSLRDLFHAINASAKRAERRDSRTISIEDAERALEELKTSLTRRIEKRDYEFLLNIYNGNKEQIEDKEKLLKMLQASVVLEYNGKRWHSVHPLIIRFFEEQGLVGDV